MSCCPLPLPAFEGIMQDVLVTPTSLIMWEGILCAMQLCSSCRLSLKNDKMPDMAMANHLYIGDIPEELRGLSIIEEALIACCCTKSYIVQLRKSLERSVPNMQQGMRGHIIVFPQQPEYILNLLPYSVEDVATYICGIFVGSRPPMSDWLKQHAHLLLVWKEKVQHALKWLQLHNCYYRDI